MKGKKKSVKNIEKKMADFLKSVKEPRKILWVTDLEISDYQMENELINPQKIGF